MKPSIEELFEDIIRSPRSEFIDFLLKYLSTYLRRDED
jgi:hypothetical protein